MKSLKDYSLNITEEEYHSRSSWSHSVIAKYARDGFGAIATLHDKFVPTPSMEFGSLFDSVITRGKETLDHYVVDNTAVAPAEKSVFDTLLASGHTEPWITISDNDLDAAIEACPTFASKYKKADTRRQKLDEASQYYDARRTGKKVVSAQDWEDAMEMYRIFRDDEYLSSIFGHKNTEDVEYLYQTQFEINWILANQKEVKVRIMPDLLVVNHKDKTVLPVDLKTSSMPAYDFAQNFIKYRYDLQAELYSDVLRKVMDRTEYKDYQLLPYLFTDVSRTDKVPVTYEFDPSNGFSYTKGDRTYQYKGWKDLLVEILDYEESQAKVPNYITTTGPNNLVEILNR
jgi:hypothetical protein